MVYRVDAGKSFLQTNYFITNLNFTKMLNKILKITAAAAFMVALAVNIDMMINDPFVGMSTEAIATDTDSGTTGNSSTISPCPGDNWNDNYEVECDVCSKQGITNQIPSCMWLSEPDAGTTCTVGVCPECGRHGGCYI